MIQKIKEIQKEIAKVLNVSPKHLVLGGSWALKFQDKLPNRMPHDIDFILVRNTIPKSKAFSLLQKAFKLTRYSSRTESLGIKVLDQDVCIFVANKEQSIQVWDSEQDLLIQDWQEIAIIKREYARDKDIQDLVDMPNYYFKPFEVEVKEKHNIKIVARVKCDNEVEATNLMTYLNAKLSFLKGKVCYIKPDRVEYIVTSTYKEYTLK